MQWLESWLRYHACVILAEQCGFLFGSPWVIVQTKTQRTYFNAVTCFQGMKYLRGEDNVSWLLHFWKLCEHLVTSVRFYIRIYVLFRSWLVLCSNMAKYCTGPGLYSNILVIFETTLCSSQFFIHCFIEHLLQEFHFSDHQFIMARDWTH